MDKLEWKIPDKITDEQAEIIVAELKSIITHIRRRHMTTIQSDLIFLAGLCVVILLAGITGGDDNVAQ